MQIVTGRRGEPHVTSRQMQAVYRSFLGDFALFDVGTHLAAAATSSDNVRISDGVVAVQGIYAVIAYNEYDDNYIEPVSVGMKRIDTLILHYTKSNDIEDMQIEVVEGEEAVDNPVAPTIAEGGDAWEGTADIKVPIYDVLVTSFGLTVTPYSRMNTLIPTLDSIAERIPESIVTGVKGDSETLYRNGNVNITKDNIGLGNVDNTADTNKPVSNATQTALNLKADLTYVDAKIAAAYHAGGSKTVEELTSALLIADNMGKVYNMSDSGVTTADFVEGAGEPINEGDNVGICNVGTEENPVYKFDLLSGFVDLSAYVTTSALNTRLAEKVDKFPGKGLSTNDYTTADKNKLAGIEAEANKTVVDSSMSTTSTNPLQNKVITAELAGTTTATGNPITIESSESNLVECTAEVEAEQDLHGYDHPWVGGAGKNKLQVTKSNDTNYGITTVNDNGTVTMSGTCTGSPYTMIFGESTYTKSKSLKLMRFGTAEFSFRVNIKLYNSNTLIYTTSDKWVYKNNQYTYDFNSYEYDRIEVSVLISNTVTASGTVQLMLYDALETDPTSYESYSNISPITGQTEVVIEDVGKNLFDKDTSVDGYRLGSDGTLFAQSGYTTSDFIRVNSSTNYARNKTMNTNECVCLYDAFRTFISRITTGTTFATTSATCYVRLSMLTTDKDTTQFEKGSTATTYEPYKGKTYTIQLGDTIYGGELDVLTGELRVTHGYVDDASTLTWIKNGSYNNIFYAYPSPSNLKIGTAGRIQTICSDYKSVASNDFSTLDQYYDHCIAVQKNASTLVIVDSTYSSASDLISALSGVQVVYELATPFTIQLTPQQIRLLKGTNNISCNTGDLSIKYYPDNVLGQLKGDIESEYDARLERLEQYTDVFGFIEDMDVLSPTERIKYIGKNENYEPLTVDLNTGSYTLGDWGNFPFLVDNKPYMVKPDGTPDYQLNEYDYTKKLDGTDSDVANEDYDGGAFSWGRKIYKKQWMVGNKRYVLYSFDKKDGFHADGFINKDGKELDGRWIPMFYGTVVDGKAKSIATGNCISGGNITTDAQHNAIIAFDSNANFFGGAFVETLIDLLMMFAKNSDLQAAYGYGNSSGYVDDSSKNYGVLNNAVVGGGQFYGRSDGKTLNKALHSIVLATYNTYMRDPYEVIKNGEVVVSEDYTYDPTGATYTDTGITVPDQSANAWRYPKKYIAVPRYGSIPDISVGGASTSLGRADGTYTLANQSGAVIVCLRFSNCADGARAGLSCRSWSNAASFTWWGVGFALLLDGSVVA